MASNGNGNGSAGLKVTTGGVLLPQSVMYGAPVMSEEQSELLKKALVQKQGPTERQQSGMLVHWDRVLGVIGNNPFDNTKITYDQMYQMRKDGMIAMGLHTLEAPIVGAEWYIKCKRADVACFIDGALRRIWPRFVLQALGSLRFGHSPIAKRFALDFPDWTFFDPQQDDGGQEYAAWDNGPNVPALVWKEFLPLAPEKSIPNWTEDGQFAGIRYSGALRLPGANMMSESGGEGPAQSDIDLNHSLWVVNEPDAHFGSIWGYPRTGHAWKAFWSYEYLWALCNRFFEKHADPPMVGYHPDGYVKNPDGTDSAQHYSTRMLNIMAAARSGSNIAMPSDVVTSEFGHSERMSIHREWEIDQLKPEGNPQWFNDRFTQLNIEKLRGLWIAEQSVIPGESGQSSRNVAATLNEGVDDSAAFLCTMLDMMVNKYVIPDLLRTNFPDFQGDCTKVTRGFSQEDITMARQLIQLIGQQDPIGLHVDTDELLRTLGIPILTGAALEQRMAEYIEQAQKLKTPAMPEDAEGNAGVEPAAGNGGGLAPNANGRDLAEGLETGALDMKYVKPRERIELRYCSELPVPVPDGVSAVRHDGQTFVLDGVPRDVAEKYDELFATEMGLSWEEDAVQAARRARHPDWHWGGIPDYSDRKLHLGEHAGGSTGARFARDAEGAQWLVKKYGGDQDRVATELLANSIYRVLGAKVPQAGTFMSEGKPALAYPTVEGELRRIHQPSGELGKHIMTDALVANWDFVGLEDDNILWGPEGPYRLDQGGTFMYRAQGARKPYGPVPTEVKTLVEGKRAKVATDPEDMKAQAARIAEVLTPTRVHELVDAAPFGDKGMQAEIEQNLNARVGWMKEYSEGRSANLAEMDLAADSLAKASTPEPFSTSKTSNWVARAGGLPPYVQHIAHALVRNGHPESRAIEIAIGVVKDPPASWGANAKAAAAKAAAEWEAKRGATKAKSAAKKGSNP